MALGAPLAVGMALMGLVLAGGCKRREQGERWMVGPPSCAALSPSCGLAGSDDCCESPRVRGGTFNRGYDGILYLDAGHPAIVSDFALDRYEVTVGRFRAFVDAGGGTRHAPPGEGAGAHPKVPESGWRSAWNSSLAADSTALKAALACHAAYRTWTDLPAGNENQPVNCLDWYTAFAFCAWDRGRLPTYAEWNYAASGGSEHRYYPWSSPATSTLVDDSYAVYCGRTCRTQDVGSRSPQGDGRWGQADLGGNVWEWTLDWSPRQYRLPCVDCAEVAAGSHRVFLGGSNDDIESAMLAASRHVSVPDYRGVVGVRCARDVAH